MAAPQLLTLRQTLPQLRRVIRHLEPTYRLASVKEVTAEFIRKEGLEGVVWDVDGTIMAYHGDKLDPAFTHLPTLFTKGPARHAILSNCDEDRFRFLGTLFSEIPVLRGYRTHEGFRYRTLRGERDDMTPEELSGLLASGGRQLRKPSAELVRYAMKVLRVEEPSRVAVVGDQYFTDIASANLAGTRSVKVDTWMRESFPKHLALSQAIENLIYRSLYSRRDRPAAQPDQTEATLRSSTSKNRSKSSSSL